MATQIKPQHHFQFFYILAAFLGLLMVQDYLSTMGANSQVLPYSQFLDMLHAGKLDHLVVEANSIRGDVKAPEKGKSAQFTTNRVEPSLAEALAADHVTFSAAPPPGWLSSAIGWVAPLALFWAVWFFISRRMASGMGGGHGRPDEHRPQPRTGVFGGGYQNPLQRHGRRGRGEKRVDGDRRVPEGAGTLRPPGRAYPQGRVAGGATGHGQDIAGAGRRRRVGRAVSSPSRGRNSSR